MARRIKYNRADINSTIKAACKKTSDGSTAYIFATYNGYTIDTRKPPFGQNYIEVTNGSKVA
jgi:hypothetical protein